MSEIAFWVSPWPSVYVKSVTLGHLLASSSASARVILRQLLSPKPSARASLTSSDPHHDGTSPLAASPPEPPPEEPESSSSPHAPMASATTRVSSATPILFLNIL